MTTIEIGANLKKILSYIILALLGAWIVYILNEGLIIIILILLLLLASSDK